MKVPLTILILTRNEEANIAQCLGSVIGWADEVFVIDCYSSDRTAEIARELGANVVQRPWPGYSAQRNWALENLPHNDWVFVLDADELMSDELKEEIKLLLAKDGDGHDAFMMRFRFIFYGKWIRHCGWYKTWTLRLFRHRLGRYETRPVDEHVIIQGKVGYCRNDLIHRDLHDLTWWIDKHNRYATLNAIAYAEIKKNPEQRISGRLFGTQRERRRWIKENIWRHLPGRGLLFFLYLYVFRLGFLDGKEGFIFCSMHGVFEHMKVAKQWELGQSQYLRPTGGSSQADYERKATARGATQ